MDEAVAFSFLDPSFPKSYATCHNITASKVRSRGDGQLVFTHDLRTYGQAAPLYAPESQTREALATLRPPLLLVQAGRGFHVRQEQEGGEGEEGAVPKLTPMQERMKERMGEKEFAAVRPNPPFRHDQTRRRRRRRCLEAAKLSERVLRRRCSSVWRRWRRPSSGGGSSCRR